MLWTNQPHHSMWKLKNVFEVDAKVMKKYEIDALFKNYENAVCINDATECWSTRKMQMLFGYSLWQNFSKVNVEVLKHFIDINKMLELGSGAFREVVDI